MLQPDAAHTVGKREQKVVTIEMARAEQAIGLAHQIAVSADLLGASFELIGPVGEDIEDKRRAPARIEIDAADIAPCEQGRIDQGFQIGFGEARNLALGFGAVERGGERPIRGQKHARRDANARDIIARRIENDRVPLQVQHLPRGDNAALIGCGGREELKAQFECSRARRRIDVKGVDIHRVAPPSQQLAVGADFQPRKHIDRPARPVIAGQPFGIEQGDRAGPGNRHGFAHAENAAGYVGRVHLKRDDSRIGAIARRGDGRGKGRGLRRGAGNAGKPENYSQRRLAPKPGAHSAPLEKREQSTASAPGRQCGAFLGAP